MPRFAFCALLLVLHATPQAAGQTLRSLVVPPDATVAVPPRGLALPAAPAAAPPFAAPPFAATPPAAPIPLVVPPAAAAAPALVPSLAIAAAPLGLAALPTLIVPFAAAALLGGSLAGGGSGGSAPATTR